MIEYPEGMTASVDGNDMTKARYGKSSGLLGDDSITYEDIERIVRAAFGDYGCRYAVELAEEDDFDSFAEAMGNLGITTCGGNCKAYDMPPAFANAVLTMRYPFLNSNVTRDDVWEMVRSNDSGSISGTARRRLIEKAFGYTEYDSIPDGWAARFGLALCEDIRTILESDVDESVDPNYSYALSTYFIEDIKEKYGTLRWYDAIYSEDEKIRDAMENLNYVYEMLSGATCIECGATQDVLMTNSGWITVLCYDHMRRNWREDEAVDAFAKSRGYEKGWVGFVLSRMIGKYLTCSDSTPVRAEPDELHVLENGLSGDKLNKRFPYSELMEAYPQLQVFRLVDTAYDVEEMEVPSLEEIMEKIAEENAKS